MWRPGGSQQRSTAEKSAGIAKLRRDLFCAYIIPRSDHEGVTDTLCERPEQIAPQRGVFLEAPGRKDGKCFTVKCVCDINALRYGDIKYRFIEIEKFDIGAIDHAPPGPPRASFSIA